MKKNYLLIFTLLIVFALSGCKKDSALETINVTVVVPNLTTYELQMTTAYNIVHIRDAATNAIFTISGHSGDKFPVTYNFVTQGEDVGQGVVTFTYNTSTILTINGGSGVQTLTLP